MSIKNSILLGDCRLRLKDIESNSIDAVVTDPPYELGFMNRSWDASGVAYNISMWEEILRVLKPGGHLLSFGGTRTYHRMACAIEDAGFEIRDQLQWLYGTGFPKNMNVSKSINSMSLTNIDVPHYQGLGTALKPANEPIVLARKPIAEKTIAANVMKYNTGALNIESSRIGGDKGRWPANLLLDKEAGEILGEPSRFFYSAKTSKQERNRGLEHRATKQVNDGRKTSIDNAYQRGDTERLNTHPTVKPIALMEYLIKLITPIGGTILDPFAGSGSTLIAANNLGFNFIGIEMNPEYVDIAKDRLRGNIGLLHEEE